MRRLVLAIGAWLALTAPVSAQWITQNGISATRFPIRLIPISQPTGTVLEGTFYYDSTAHAFKVYTGSTGGWVAIGTILGSSGPILGIGTGVPDATHPINAQVTTNADALYQFWNLSTGSAAQAEIGIKSDTARLNIALEGKNSSDAFGKERAQIYSATGSGTAGTSGIDLVACEAATPTLCFLRFITNGLSTGVIRATIDVNGLTLNNGTSIQSTATTGLAVANVGANSCGTTTATIAGSNFMNVITTGTVSVTQCRITFSFAATTEWDCVANDSTTSGVVVRTTPVDTTHTDILGTITAGDKITSVCVAR